MDGLVTRPTSFSLADLKRLASALRSPCWSNSLPAPRLRFSGAKSEPRSGVKSWSLSIRGGCSVYRVLEGARFCCAGPNAMRSLRIVPLGATPETRLRRNVSGWMMTGLSCHCSRQRENKIQNRRSQRRKAGATSSAAPVNTRNTDAETGCRVRTIRSEAKCRYPPRRDTASWASRLPVAATRPRAPAEREDRKGAE